MRMLYCPFLSALSWFQMKARQPEVAQRGGGIQQPQPYQSRSLYDLELEAGLPLHQAPRHTTLPVREKSNATAVNYFRPYGWVFDGGIFSWSYM